jgi:hypothetical protein
MKIQQLAALNINCGFIHTSADIWLEDMPKMTDEINIIIYLIL